MGIWDDWEDFGATWGDFGVTLGKVLDDFGKTFGQLGKNLERLWGKFGATSRSLRFWGNWQTLRKVSGYFGENCGWL